MQQDVFIFEGDVAYNIRLNDDNITDAQVKAAAEYVNASHFIEKLPQGYHEPVTERGATFSAGERQLLSFARTLAHNPSILVMDEATANIDTETEILIQEALESLWMAGQQSWLRTVSPLSSMPTASWSCTRDVYVSAVRTGSFWSRMAYTGSCMSCRYRRDN